MRAVAGDADQQESVQMLQRAARRAAEAPVPPELQQVLPIAWVHVPKCGSSFLNTLIHLPTVCDDSIPGDLVVDHRMGGHFLGAFRQKYNPANACPGLLCANFGHDGIDERVGYENGKGHFTIMLRQPEQRIISAYGDMRQGASNPDPSVLVDPGTSWGGWPTGTLPSLPEYANATAGCAVRMLTRDGLPCGAAGGYPSESEVSFAKQRLREGFAFVGLTEKWELSMCLFDTMFNVPCQSWQFGSSRPSHQTSQNSDDAGYDLEPLKGVRDPFDGALYAEAQKIFEENLKRYNVSEASCEPCFRAAGISLASIGSRISYENEH